MGFGVLDCDAQRHRVLESEVLECERKKGFERL